MLVFELYINGKLLSRGGQSDLAVLSASVTAVGVLGPKSSGAAAKREDINIDVNLGGLISEGGTYPNGNMNWFDSKLEVGDEVTIKLCESSCVRTPIIAFQAAEISA